MNNIKKRTIAVLSAATLLLTSGMGAGISLTAAKADYLNSVTVVVDEDFEDLNILTRKKGSYSADMVYTMIYDRLLTLNEDGNFALGLIEYWVTLPENLYGSAGGESMSYPNIDYAPGWEVQPEFTDPSLYETTDNDIAICRLRRGVKFQNDVDLTVGSLINLIDLAKAQPTDTLIYQTWAPVIITPVDDYTFFLGINAKGFNFGFMDVIYNMASPQGSIVYVEDGILESTDYPIGSGAYQLEEVTEYSVSFERWNGWWSEETVPTQYVTLKYISDSQEAERELLANYASAAVMRDSIYYNNSKLLYWDQGVEGGRGYYSIEGNPLALFFNTDPTKSMFGGVEYRQAATLALEKKFLRESGVLYEKSNGFWCYLTDDDTADIFEDSGLDYARSLLEEAGGIENGTVIDIVIYDDDGTYFSNETYEQYYINACISVQQYLMILFDLYENITVNLISASESQMAAYEANGNYDIILKEIDLHNVNSAHNVLYGKGNSEIDAGLYNASISVNTNTFMLMHLAAQYYNYTESVYVTNLGWQQRAVIWNENVSGISVCGGFCPMGDSSTLDFRFIAVTAA